jgi:hypothetical protein
MLTDTPDNHSDAGELPPRREAIAEKGSGKEPKVRLLSLGDLDGRTRAAQMVSKTIDNLVADLGGDDALSTAEHLIVRRAAIAGAMSEDLAARWLTGETVDPAVFATLANVERRQLESVGIKRRPRDVTQSLSHYLDNRSGIST